jgi:hypothetical protein
METLRDTGLAEGRPAVHFSQRYYWLYKKLKGYAIPNVVKTTMSSPSPTRNVSENRSPGPFRTNLAGKLGGVLDCRDHLTESYPMSDEQDLNAQRTRMMKIWHEYGKTYDLFVPKEQPDPQRTPVNDKEQALSLFRLFL